GAAVLELMRQGIEPAEIAVLLRGDAGTTALFAQVLGGSGTTVSHDRRVPLARTRLGAGVLAGARAALPGGTAADLMTWLRTPGRLADPDAADRLQTGVRRTQVAPAAGLERWGRRTEVAPAAATRPRLAGPDESAALDALADAAAAGPEAFLD